MLQSQQSPFIGIQTVNICATSIPTTSIPLNSFRTLGYSVFGDGGDAIYIKGTSSGPMAIQDATGQWWKLATTGEWSSKSFGAKGDGSTNDTTALNNWLSALATYSQGGFAPTGVYMHSGLTLTTANGIGPVIRGFGAGFTIFRTIIGTTNPILTYSGGGGFGMQGQPTFQDLTFDGNNYNSGHGVYVTASGGYPESPNMRNVTILKPGLDGLYLGTGAGAGSWFNVMVAHPGRHGLNLINAADNVFINCSFYGASNAGFAASATAQI